MKCQVPSYVSDFVHVISWITEDSEFVLGSDYGRKICVFEVRMNLPTLFLSKYLKKIYW